MRLDIPNMRTPTCLAGSSKAVVVDERMCPRFRRGAFSEKKSIKPSGK